MSAEGLSHLTLVVKDLEPRSHFVVSMLGGSEVYRSGQKAFPVSDERFYDVAGVWIAVA